jgi:hypothetical protein
LIGYFDSEGDTDYEGTPADHDSGGGWFVKLNDVWYVAALSQGVKGHYDPVDPNIQLYESWFDDPTTGHNDPDWFFGVRVSSYAEWVNSIIFTDGDINRDDEVDFEDFSIAANNWQEDCNQSNEWCDGADIEEPFGIVDFNDLSIIFGNWLAWWGD